MNYAITPKPLTSNMKTNRVGVNKSVVVSNAFAIQNVIPEWPLKSPLHINNFKGLLIPLFIITVHMLMHLSWFAKQTREKRQQEVHFYQIN